MVSQFIHKMYNYPTLKNGQYTPVRHYVASHYSTIFTGRLDSVEWNGGLEWWNGLEWNGGMERCCGNFNWWSPLYKDHLLTKTTSL